MRRRDDGIDPVADLTRRIRLITHRNPGHSPGDIRQAAEDEASAISALAIVDAAGRDAAKLKLRTAQLRASNLDMSEATARDLARIQLAGEPSHFTGHFIGNLLAWRDPLQ